MRPIDAQKGEERFQGVDSCEAFSQWARCRRGCMAVIDVASSEDESVLGALGSKTQSIGSPDLDAGSQRASLTIPIVLTFGALLYGTVRQGGFYPHQFTIFGALMVAATSVLVAKRFSTVSPRLLSIVPFAAAVAISAVRSGGWSSAASAWSVGMVAAFGAWNLAALADDEERDLLLIGVQLVALAVAATSIWGVLARRTPWARQIADVWRGESMLTYANATASLLVVVLFPTMALAVCRRSRFLAGVCVVLVVGIASTQNRSGWLLLAAGAVAQIVLSREARTAMLRAWVVIGVASVVPAGVLAVQSGVGARIPVSLAVASIIAGVIAAAALWESGKEFHLAIVSGVAALASLGLPRVRNGLAPVVRNRLDPESLFTRFEEWGATMRVWGAHPWTGAGPGKAALSFDRDGQNFIALFAHNEFLQVGAEIGVLGIIGLSVALVVGMRAMRRARVPDRTVRVENSESSALRAAAVVATGVFLAHSSLDFLWHLPLLVVVAGLVAGLASVSSANGTATSTY